MALDITAIREHFPALRHPAIFLDNPGGTQIVQQGIDRMNAYLVEHNANFHGAFRTSRESDAVLEKARSAAADFLNARRPDEIVFGPNMTTLTFNISRSLARTWIPGDDLVVTRLDHDANITPWTLAAEERGCTVKWVDFNPEDGTLNMEDLRAALEGRPRLVAVGYASNALGTINPISEITEMAHAAGALVYVDAVHFAPHSPIDVQQLGCDLLVCSAYKFFGPHTGFLFGRYELLEGLEAYRVRPAPRDPPGKFEQGTKNHEGIAGFLGTLEYLERLGVTFGEQYGDKYDQQFSGRRLRLKCAMAAIRAYEYELSRSLLDILSEMPGTTIYGLQNARRLEECVPTFSFTLQDWHPRQVAKELDKSGIYVWDGNYYTLAVTERLSLEETGGMVRVGAVHYNTLDEITQFGEALARIGDN